MPKRALTMVSWFEAQPDRTTTLRDREQALRFDAVSPADGWVHAGALMGDERMVRSVRRWVDNEKVGEFADYVFGTKRAGRGVTQTVLYNKDARLGAATNGTTSQLIAAEQYERRTAEEIGRIILKLQADSEEWFQLGDFARSMACNNAANEYDQFGKLRQQTREALKRLGLVT